MKNKGIINLQQKLLSFTFKPSLNKIRALLIIHTIRSMDWQRLIQKGVNCDMNWTCISGSLEARLDSNQHLRWLDHRRLAFGLHTCQRSTDWATQSLTYFQVKIFGKGRCLQHVIIYIFRLKIVLNYQAIITDLDKEVFTPFLWRSSSSYSKGRFCDWFPPAAQKGGSTIRPAFSCALFTDSAHPVN